jgi:hypothetical protein
MDEGEESEGRGGQGLFLPILCNLTQEFTQDYGGGGLVGDYRAKT